MNELKITKEDLIKYQSLSIKEYSFIRWQCRRGMLELDEILLNFLNTYYAYVPPITKKIFIKLLQENDADLFDYFFNEKLSLDQELNNLISLITATKAKS